MKTNGKRRFGYDRNTQLELHAMLLPGTLLILVFSIIPLFGILVAFKDYKPAMGWMGIFTAPFDHFRNFRQVFRSSQFWPMLRNTLGINLIGQAVTIPMTILFALFVNELRNKKFRSVVQTATYMPHFLSWAIYGGLVVTMLSPDGGLINVLLQACGLIREPISFMAKVEYFWAIAIISGLLKELGWGTIIYLAAIAGVDPDLYEAAAIDGATRFHRMFHITLPGILPTVMIMIIFAVAGMLNNNFTQIYVLQNSLNRDASQVIDTYVYQIGMQQFQFGVATAANLMKSVFALLLLGLANFASKKLTDTGLF
ncbi:MAG TPA: ABC transporter permease subunit [Candidatus Eisenbergiella merdavium]|uniref:ABC transporter permease subunit n=1 Tax=Candidatus Eisenbergiella merdavium TaxID=2838551 RepID=A0A9D2NI01_9FIRM|nr:ABC transporter permease subunit [Candidatus Eisenbergiella merdavium]